MRYLAVLALLVAAPVFAYDVTAVMPPTAGATSCTLYLDGVAVGGQRTCGTTQNYPNLIAADGTYQFRYLATNAGGDSPLSPIRTVTISTTQPPPGPVDPPDVTVACNPAPCAQSITIVITP
jgi:hypothetical protein